MKYVSAYHTQNTRTTHQRVCDYYVKKARSQRTLTAKVNRDKTLGINRNDYSAAELKIFLEKCLTN